MHRAGIDELLADAVARGVAPGIVAGVVGREGVRYLGAAGQRGLDDPAAMMPDTVLRLASMTKAITAAAALQAIEAGRLALDAPIGAWLPELAAPQVLEGFDPADAPILRPARGAITLRALLTHSAGFAYPNWNPLLGRWIAAAGVPAVASGTLAALRLPLMFDPGTAWEYGIGIDWAGLAVEAAAGARLDAVFADGLFGPLGMVDTGFDPPRARVAGQHRRHSDGRLEAIPLRIPDAPEVLGGGGALFGTVPDYLRFCRMLLDGGSFGGTRVLGAASVAAMFADQIATLAVRPMRSAVPEMTNDVDLLDGADAGWSLGFLVNRVAIPGRRSAGSVGWAGIINAYCWIDPARGVAGVLATQVLPFADHAVLDLFARFEGMVTAAAEP